MRRSDVGTRFAVEYWGHQYGEMTWIETGYQDCATHAEAEKLAEDTFADWRRARRTRIVEYTTTSRVISEHDPSDED